MKSIKIKKVIPLALLTGVLILSGCESKDAIQKDTLMTEEDAIKNEVSENMTEEQAKEIAEKSFKKYFNEDVDAESLFEHTELIEIGDNNSEIIRESWEVAWSTFDRNRLKDTGKLTEDEKSKLYTDYNSSKSYYIEIEGKSGSIRNIYVDEQVNQDVSLEGIKDIKHQEDELKNMALDYIKENKLVDNVEDLKFLLDTSVDPNISILVFADDKDQAIIIRIESISKKIIGFIYQDEQFVRDVMRDAKNSKSNDLTE